MVMELTQVRLPKELVKGLSALVRVGLYTSKSDLVRDALRKFLIEKRLERQIGSIPNTGDSVKEVREIRKKLSKQIKSFKDLQEINKLAD